MRWNIQRGVIPTVKSETIAHMKQNISLDYFSLSEMEMSKIDALNKELRFGPNPENIDSEIGKL